MSTVAPNSDVSAIGWSAQPLGAYYIAIAVASADDPDYIYTPVNGASAATFGLAASIASGSHTARVRAGTASGTASIRVRLLTTADVSVGLSNYQTVAATPATYAFPITSTGVADRIRLEVWTTVPNDAVFLASDPLFLGFDYVSLT
jgi:hypothetical protein